MNENELNQLITENRRLKKICGKKINKMIVYMKIDSNLAILLKKEALYSGQSCNYFIEKWILENLGRKKRY
jgi:hypothetical protein